MEDDAFVLVPLPGSDEHHLGPEIRITSHEPSPVKGQAYTGPTGIDFGVIPCKDGPRAQDSHFLTLPNEGNTLSFASEGFSPELVPTPSGGEIHITPGPEDRRPIATNIRITTGAEALCNKISKLPATPDTPLGLTSEEIAILRHHQQEAVSLCGGSSSRAWSRASSQGLLLLDGHSLAMLSRHFDCLLRQIQSRLNDVSNFRKVVEDHSLFTILQKRPAKISTAVGTGANMCAREV